MNTFEIRIPTREEVVRTFGSAKRAIRLTHCDLPTALHFIANPEKVTGFISPGGRRVDFPQWGVLLRQWSKEETMQGKEKVMFHVTDGKNHALIEATRESLAKERFIEDNYADLIKVQKVGAMEAITLAGLHGLKPIVVAARTKAQSTPPVASAIGPAATPAPIAPDETLSDLLFAEDGSEPQYEVPAPAGARDTDSLEDLAQFI